MTQGGVYFTVCTPSLPQTRICGYHLSKLYINRNIYMVPPSDIVSLMMICMYIWIIRFLTYLTVIITSGPCSLDWHYVASHPKTKMLIWICKLSIFMILTLTLLVFFSTLTTVRTALGHSLTFHIRQYFLQLVSFVILSQTSVVLVAVCARVRKSEHQCNRLIFVSACNTVVYVRLCCHSNETWRWLQNCPTVHK